MSPGSARLPVENPLACSSDDDFRRPKTQALRGGRSCAAPAMSVAAAWSPPGSTPIRTSTSNCPDESLPHLPTGDLAVATEVAG